MGLLKILGANLTTASNFDIYIDTSNVRRISATSSTIVINYAGSAAGTQTVTVNIPSDTSGIFQRQFIALFISANKAEPFTEAPATFTNGETAINNKISSVTIA